MGGGGLPGVIDGEQLLVSGNSIPERRGGMKSFIDVENLANKNVMLPDFVSLNYCHCLYVITPAFYFQFNSELNS